MAVVDKRAWPCPLQSHLTCSYLHAIQSQRSWAFPATAQSATSSTSPLEGERRGQSAADAAKELSQGCPFSEGLLCPGQLTAGSLSHTDSVPECQPNALGYWHVNAHSTAEQE